MEEISSGLSCRPRVPSSRTFRKWLNEVRKDKTLHLMINGPPTKGGVGIWTSSSFPVFMGVGMSGFVGS